MFWLYFSFSDKYALTFKESGEEIETMSTKEALLFPVIASVTLFSIYVIFQVIGIFSNSNLFSINTLNKCFFALDLLKGSYKLALSVLLLLVGCPCLD